VKVEGIDEEKIKKSDTEAIRDRGALRTALELINGDDSEVKKTVEILHPDFAQLNVQTG